LAGFDHPWVDASRSPIIANNLPAAGFDSELATFLIEREIWIYAASAPYGWLVDMRHMSSTNPRHRRMWADHMRRIEAQQARWCFGVAIVATPGWMRATLNAILWVREPPCPFKAFRTRTEALHWLEERSAGA
jgi:hypothetical protein